MSFENNELELRVMCVQPMFEDENFKIFRAIADFEKHLFPFKANEPEGQVSFVVKGSVAAPIYKGQTLDVVGRWIYDSKYQQHSFAASYASPLLPSTEEGVMGFCVSVDGIGKRVAARVAQQLPHGFTLASGEMVEADWLVASIKGMTPAKAGRLINALQRVNASGELAKLLKGCVGGEIIDAIVVQYGEKSVELISAKPYKPFYDHVLSFPKADAVAMALGMDVYAEERLEAGIYDQIFRRRQVMSAIIAEREKVVSGATRSLGVSQDVVQKQIERLSDSNQVVDEQGYLYLARDYDTEVQLANHIAAFVEQGALVKNGDKARYMKNFENWKQSGKISLAEKQESAVEAVAGNVLTVLTGGPGTGKTTVLKAVLETYRKTYPGSPVTLMAPAGLAAKRLSEACGFPAATIHSTLGLIPTEGAEGIDDSGACSLDGGLVIVDEVSMVGIHLAKYIFELVALKPDTRVVLVGDADQLPSVSPGSVLDDLINCGKVKVTRLDKNFRQGSSAIVDAANAINSGRPDLLRFGGNFRMRVVEGPTLDEETKNILDNVKRAFAWSIGEFGLEQTYVLTPKRKAKAGESVDTLLSSAYLNPILRDIANPQSADKDFVKIGSRLYRMGDRVINLKNSNETMNGEIGHIVKIDKGDVTTVTIKYSNNEVEYTTDRLNEVDLAYAITVHKSQGNEYDSVIYPSSKTHGPMLQRNLLYTAVTRAKKSAVVIGSRDALKCSILTVKTKNRKDFLANRVNKLICS